MKPFLCMLLIVCLILGGLGTYVHRGRICELLGFIDPGLVFNSIGEDSYEVAGYTGDASELIIPASYQGKPVVAIGDSAFEDCHSLSTITIPSSVITIGDYAFIGCDSLQAITIPASITTIGIHAFGWCDSLTTVNFVEESQLTTIDLGAFSYCESLSEIEIPSSVTTIGIYAFLCCESLATITIPSSVSIIGESAFGFCSSLAEINVAEENSAYRSVDGDLYSKDGTVLVQYAIGKTATAFNIPSSVTNIGHGAFRHSGSLEIIAIPTSVINIGDYAFADCSLLTMADFAEGSQLVGIGQGAFSSCSALSSIMIPASVTTIGFDAFEDCDALMLATFEATNGWKVDTAELLATELSEPGTAATYLTSTYEFCEWTKD